MNGDPLGFSGPSRELVFGVLIKKCLVECLDITVVSRLAGPAEIDFRVMITHKSNNLSQMERGIVIANRQFLNQIRRLREQTRGGL